MLKKLRKSPFLLMKAFKPISRRLWVALYLRLKVCQIACLYQLEDNKPLDLVYEEIEKWKSTAENLVRRKGLPFIIPYYFVRVRFIIVISSTWVALVGMLILGNATNLNTSQVSGIYLGYLILIAVVAMTAIKWLKHGFNCRIFEWVPSKVCFLDDYDRVANTTTFYRRYIK